MPFITFLLSKDQLMAEKINKILVRDAIIDKAEFLSLKTKDNLESEKLIR